jgi:hypothetical protein
MAVVVGGGVGRGNARRKHRLRHGGGRKRLDLDDLDLPATAEDDKLLAWTKPWSGSPPKRGALEFTRC